MAKDNKLYSILGVSTEAALSDIRKAYRILALKHHPDKNHHSEESKARFLEVCNAYEILSDERKRKLYDEYGTVDEVAIQQQQQQQQQHQYQTSSSSFFKSAGPMGMSAGDMFAQFFDNVTSTPMSGFGAKKNEMPTWSSAAPEAAPRRNRGPDIKHSLKCTLSELYSGKKIKLGLNRRRICFACNGNGAMKKTTCTKCHGQGQISETRSLGPMVQTWTQTCPDCNGTGCFTKTSDICKDCQGEGCLKERKIFDVEVKPGMAHGQMIILPGEADEIITTSYGTEKVLPGDVVITINQVRDPKFQRCNTNGCDLLLKSCKIPLSTSLCGGDLYIDGHPSSKLLKISIIPGELIKPNCFKSVENMGMPKFNGGKHPCGDLLTAGHGNLYIQFQVEFPKTLNADTVSRLLDVLQNDPNVKDQIASQDNTVNERLGDCVEVEDHVLSNFVPDFSDLKSMHNKDIFNDNESNNENNKRRKKYYTQQEEDLGTSSDGDDLQNCTIH